MANNHSPDDETTDRLLLDDDPVGQQPTVDREATVLLDDQSPTPPPSHTPFDAEAPTPPPQDFESISSSGFIPQTNFQKPSSAQPSTSSSSSQPAWKEHLPDFFKGRSLKTKDDAELADRLQFGGGGVLAGAIIGTFLGLLNTVLQGWHISAGLPQIFALAALLAFLFGAMGALRPRRIQSLLDSLNDRLS